MEVEARFWLEKLKAVERENSLLRGFLVQCLHESKDAVVRGIVMETFAELRAAGVPRGDVEAIFQEFDMRGNE
jgi:hypothetical protein